MGALLLSLSTARRALPPLLAASLALLLSAGLPLVGAPSAGPTVRAASTPTAPTLTCPIPAAEQERPATELRAALGRLLGEHAYLLMDAMRARAAAAPDAEALAGRLDENSDALRGAIEGVYGQEAGAAFGPLWQRHIDAALAYATAAANGDTAARDQAMAELESFRADLDAFLQGANPQLGAEDEAHALELHVDQLLAFAEGDYAEAYRAAREAYGHMFSFGDALARAIAQQDPATYPDARIAFSPASTLRLSLDRLLGEHLVLAAEAMRASLEEAPSLPAARQALDGNTADLAAAVGSVYGDEAGAAFTEVWNAHLTAYLDYIDAVNSGDTERREATRRTLKAYGPVLGSFLAGANPNLTQEAVSELIGHHTDALLAMVDQYEAGDYAAGQATVAEAYEHMFTVGDALAGAIAAQFPDRFEDLAELPPTDTGAGHEGAHGSSAMTILLLLAAAVLFGSRLIPERAWRRLRS